jgi:phospholipase D1/2
MPHNTPRSKARRWALAVVAVLIVVMLALIAAWRWTPLQEVAQPRAIAGWFGAMADSVLMPPLVALVYVAASLVMFPNTVLCLGVILALGPVEGAAYAYGGSLTAALTGYVMGRRGGKRVDKLRLRSFDRISAELRHGGFAQVLMLRLLPIAPFTATNVLSGAARVRLLPFVAATLVGISPYILTFAAFGQQARRLLSDPTPLNVAVAVVIVLLAVFALWQARALAATRRK